MFHFTPHIEYSDLGKNSRYTVRQTVQTAFKSSCSGLRQTPKTYIWPLMLRCKTDTKLFSFLPLLTYLVILNVLWTWRFKLCILIKLTDHVHIHEFILICQYLTYLSALKGLVSLIIMRRNTVMVIFAGGKFRENVGKTFHVGVIFTIILIFLW